MSFILKEELLQSQDTWKRSQIRLTPSLYDAVMRYAEENILSLNSALMYLIDEGLTSTKKTIKRKIIFTEWHPLHELEDSSDFISHNNRVRMSCSEYMSDFFNEHPSYELIKFEFKSRIQRICKKDHEILFGIRIWYSYPA
ncbi:MULTISPECIES: hypothetical protein [unclassified Psychrobacter]|uniref:hypothetical protein n=1 Tax=unclassified Psychrobacter TaxID=196806 RepID=UPI0018F6C0AB|nr:MULTISPECIES: hypothetical protein [unclassified Psychrobacter]